MSKIKKYKQEDLHSIECKLEKYKKEGKFLITSENKKEELLLLYDDLSDLYTSAYIEGLLYMKENKIADIIVIKEDMSKINLLGSSIRNAIELYNKDFFIRYILLFAEWMFYVKPISIS